MSYHCGIKLGSSFRAIKYFIIKLECYEKKYILSSFSFDAPRHVTHARHGSAHQPLLYQSLDVGSAQGPGKASQRYKISFIYNELEDFTVTTSFSNLTLPEALGNVFGFYPLKATVEDSLIFVECTQKEPTKLMGRVWDEHHRPIEFANVALLNPQDSSFITGGVTNASGNFVIPCDMKRVIAKVSCVGYHTLYNIYIM